MRVAVEFRHASRHDDAVYALHGPDAGHL